MDSAGLPRMGTESDPMGKIQFIFLGIHIKDFLTDVGYTNNLSDGPVTFSTAIRAPCEGYILQDYVA
jgi:hypothetical protein